MYHMTYCLMSHDVCFQGICDLLDPSFTDLKIREDKDVRVNACQEKSFVVCVLQNNVKVHGLKEYVVTNIEEVTRVIFVGNSEFFLSFLL